MKTTRQVVGFTLTILGLLCAAQSQQGPPPTQEIKQEKKRCYLPEALWDIGDKYNVYFTLETGRAVTVITESTVWSWLGGGGYPPVAPLCDYLLPGATDVYQELQALQHDLVDLGFVVDSRDPKIIHVYDKELLTHPAYPMGKELGSFQFRGTELELAHWLYQSGFRVTFRTDGKDDLSEDRPEDPRCDPLRYLASTTHVDVDLHAATVREALSSFTPTDRKERILWQSSAFGGHQPYEGARLELGFHVSKGDGRTVIFRKWMSRTPDGALICPSDEQRNN